MATIFNSEHPAGDGSPFDVQIEGENFEYEDSVGDTFPITPPDLPSPVKAEEQPVIIVDDIPSHTIKKEDVEEPFPWRDMGSNIIELLESDDEPVVLPRSDLSNMNSESTKLRPNIPALLSSATRVRDSPRDTAKMLEIQRKCVERILDKSIPSSAIFKGRQPPPDQSATDGEEDQHAWMKADVEFDTDAAATFVSPAFTHNYIY